MAPTKRRRLNPASSTVLAQSQHSTKVTGLEVQLSNHGARKLEGGRLDEAVVILTRAAQSFSKDATIDINSSSRTLDYETIKRLRHRRVSTAFSSIMHWCSEIPRKFTKISLQHEEDEDTILFVYRRAIFTLPTLNSFATVDNKTVYAVSILYNLALCHHMLAIEKQQRLQEHSSPPSFSEAATTNNEIELAYRYYHHAQMLLNQSDQQHPELQMILLNNMGCLHVWLRADVHAGSQCFQALTFEIEHGFNHEGEEEEHNGCQLFDDRDAVRMALNSLYNSIAATAA